MSWAHLLSFSRIVAGPVIGALILDRAGDAYLLAAVLFALSSLTDLVDGKLARYSRRVSPLGIFLDTTADKVLVGLTLVSLAASGLVAVWIALVVVGREFIISGLRSYAASCQQVISAHMWGKGKTAVTMVAIFCLLMTADGRAGGSLAGLASPHSWRAMFTAATWLLNLAVILTIISGARYLVDAWPLFRPGPRMAEVQSDERSRAVAGRDR